ncbi:MAG: Carboxypeptidase G2 [Chlamydiales bacterium]|nr:Carboxypeptidase G2 [Chlamydiales bacterium]
MKIIETLEKWASVNSHSLNGAGLEEMVHLAEQACTSLHPDEIQRSPLGLCVKKRKNAPTQIFLGGHLDTVFSIDHPFQSVKRLDAERLQGPGVTDMKGGILVMLLALQEFEASPHAEQVGWEIFLNLDEELGSPRSSTYHQECAPAFDYALIFEPTLPDGSFVSARKGSSTYSVVSYGVSAHAGRHPEKGKNAIYPLSKFISRVEKLHTLETVVNVGLIKGGEAFNIVPDYAEATLNIRSYEELQPTLQKLAEQEGVELNRLTYRPPKLFDAQTKQLFSLLKECGEALGQKVKWKETGGVCDGNTFGKAGVPTIDTMGVEGDKIHTDQEYIWLPSITKKAQLTARLLEELAKRGT